MKKIFLPLLALVGMVSCFTLSSCGGGGGGDSFTGREYEITRTFGAMRLVFDSQYTSNSEIVEGAYSAYVCFKEQGSNYTKPDTCDVVFSKEIGDDGQVTGKTKIKISGMGSETLEENAVMAFLGQALQGDDDEGEITNLEFYILTSGLPQSVGEIQADAAVYVEQLDVEVAPDAADNDGENLEDKAEEAKKNPDPYNVNIKRIL